MTTYNWANLSDYDFEMVCRDVMSTLCAGPVEAFPRGRDGGVDLRFMHPQGEGWTLGQAKHYLRTPYSSLVAAARSEKTKIDEAQTKPSRYLLFTSQPVSPHRKDKLHTALQPYCTSPADVLGLEDIEGLIARNPEIEKHHYKLWLSSVRVLQEIMGNATLSRSRIRVPELLEKARLFVEHDSLADAEKILREEKSVIISGAPGIGKTTLAEMLCLRFLSAGYQVHFVSTVDDLEREHRPGEKQLFVYDDFLGRTTLAEAPRASEQERLFSFMRHARTAKNQYLIMTTREYLFRQAKAANERMTQNRADVVKCLLDVSGYSKKNRAKILYNHLYWKPGIPREALEHFVHNKGYRRVIEHQDFNPRFIADTIDRLVPQAPAQQEDDGLWI